jgi:hypothetical protein
MARVCGHECKSNCILKIFLKELSFFFCFFELILFKKNNGNYSNERRAPQLFEVENVGEPDQDLWLS